ncbi:BTAD domain-containing putative transcriptional regulator [Roseibium marinum]|uniref:DNA-binding SARP family transcriptional activator n=1 Tax=Roseibium marinum TaxID=281252 RepID=A0A2S3UK93_9HYPH|nr:BTAD domain-containing putative transcriptional regulator [Roseibium marinum]POF27929.1 DNA-binding SARP family transcriptional activator [Roseibium marinum]
MLNPAIGLNGSHITINIIDGFSLQGAKNTGYSVRNRKSCGLLSYLALNRNHRETRERLVGLLWSDRPEKQARASLRQSLKQLRQFFEELHYEGFDTGHVNVTLDPHTVSTDLSRVVDLLGRNVVSEPLLQLSNLPERILYGFETLDQSFAAWLHVVRQNWNTVIVTELRRIIGDVHLPGETVQAAAEALLRIDPTHEEAHRSTIRFHANNGNTAAALKQYNELWDILDRDYDMEPELETQTLIADIKAGTFTPAAVLSPVVTTTVQGSTASEPAVATEAWYPTIRVFPFLAGGIDPHDAMAGLVEGFRQDLIASMVRFRDWIVLDHAQQVPDETGNDWTLSDRNKGYSISGTHYQDGDDVHLLMTLKNLQTNRYVWSERLRLSHDNWFAAQREFIKRMSASMSIYLTAQHLSQQIASHALPKDAYRPWLSAYRMIWSWDPQKRAEAEEIFKGIIERFPDFAPAYSGLASICNTEQVIYPGFSASPERLKTANHLSRTAVALDPLDVRSHIALAWSNGMIGQHDQAANHHRLVYDLNPNNPTTLFSCACGLAMCGDLDAARDIAGQAMSLISSVNPVQWAYLTSTRFVCGDYRGCVKAADSCGEALPMVPGFKAAALGLIGAEAEAVDAGERYFTFIRDRWQGEAPCTRESAAQWFLQHCPVKNNATRARMREGLAKAGLPTS